MTSQSIDIPEIDGLHQIVPQVDDALGMLYTARDSQTGRQVQVRWVVSATSAR